MKEFKSFYDWCINNNKMEYLDNWDYGLNKVSPKECSYGTAKKLYFLCPRGIHESSLLTINNLTSIDRIGHKECYCHKCNSFGQWCIDNHKKDLLELWDYELNQKDPFDVGYMSNDSYYFKCVRGLHESHRHILYSITNKSANQVKCPKCNSLAQHTIDTLDISFDDFVKCYWSDKNIKSPYEIAHSSKTKVWMKCQICGDDYQVRADHFCRGVRHHGCSLSHGKSRLQELVEKYIKSNYSQYTLLHEQYCTLHPKSPITNYPLFYDNEIKELKLIIEVHGTQHYKITSWHKKAAAKMDCTPEEFFSIRKLYDEYKENYAKEHNYNYLIIPFWDEKYESYKKLIDDKIKELVSQSSKE